jgi:N-acetyl-alpha-D-muramate 1-phosphate uridylyltransferase
MLPAAILAGGLGTRLYPVTRGIPKALVDIHGEPFIAHQLRLLARRGLQRAVLCVGHLGHMIRDFVGDGARFGMAVEYSFDGAVLLGTAGAIRQALPLLGGAFFALYGDSYLPCDYAAVQSAFEAAGRPALMTVFHNQGRWDTSNVEFTGGRILAYDKRHPTPAMRHIDYGLGVFTADAFANIPAPYDLAALYQDLLRRDCLAVLEVHQRFYEVGSPEGAAELSRSWPLA